MLLYLLHVINKYHEMNSNSENKDNSQIIYVPSWKMEKEPS